MRKMKQLCLFSFWRGYCSSEGQQRGWRFTRLMSVETMKILTRILLVDDEEAVLFGLSGVLLGPGIAVDCARSADEALGLIEANHYTAAIIDMSLSKSVELEGLMLINKIKAKQKECRIIVVSGHGEEDVMHRAIVKGAHMFFVKPYEPCRVKETLKTMHVL